MYVWAYWWIKVYFSVDKSVYFCSKILCLTLLVEKSVFSVDKCVYYCRNIPFYPLKNILLYTKKTLFFTNMAKHTHFTAEIYTFIHWKIHFSPLLGTNLNIWLQKYTPLFTEKMHFYPPTEPKHTHFTAELSTGKIHFSQPIGQNIQILMQKYTLLSTEKYTFSNNKVKHTHFTI